MKDSKATFRNKKSTKKGMISNEVVLQEQQLLQHQPLNMFLNLTIQPEEIKEEIKGEEQDISQDNEDDPYDDPELINKIKNEMKLKL